MSFFLTITAYLVSFAAIVRYRERLGSWFMRKFRTRTRAALGAAFVFSLFEEGIINASSGTLHVLVATVPVLMVFVFSVGKLGQFFAARRITWPLVMLMVAGLVFEATVGGAHEGFQHPESPAILIFAIALTLLTYAYCGLVALTIMIGRDERATV